MKTILMGLLMVSMIFMHSSLLANDLDGDGIDGEIDNCPSISNLAQDDTDLDGAGNECDSDDDGDTVPDAIDPAPLDSSVP